MTATLERPQSDITSEFERLMDVVSAMFALKSVVRLTRSRSEYRMHFWAHVHREAIPESTATLYGLEYDLLSEFPSLPIEIHVVPIEDVSPGAVPEGHLIFDRSAAPSI
jgi:hypothetical protein